VQLVAGAPGFGWVAQKTKPSPAEPVDNTARQEGLGGYGYVGGEAMAALGCGGETRERGREWRGRSQGCPWGLPLYAASAASRCRSRERGAGSGEARAAGARQRAREQWREVGGDARRAGPATVDA
jgi:hypothetical protein